MRRSHAYNLVEVMVVMVILLILATIAFSSYASYIVRTRRAEAQAALMQLLQEQERYYSQHNTYLAFSSVSQGADEQQFRWWSGSSAQSSAYELSGQACAKRSLQSCIELRAVPGTGKVDSHFRDQGCETLTLDSTGQHGASGQQPRCWP